MRVLALGGSGGMGRFAVREAMKMESIYIDRIDIQQKELSASKQRVSPLFFQTGISRVRGGSVGPRRP